MELPGGWGQAGGCRVAPAGGQGHRGHQLDYGLGFERPWRVLVRVPDGRAG